MKSKLLSFLVIILSAFLLTACNETDKGINATENTKSVIAQAQTMSLEQLALKAIEESNGKTFYGVGNSSRGKPALNNFVNYLKKFNASYTLDIEWQQPKNNKIYDQLSADAAKSTGTFAMTLIQDGNQINSKMVKTGFLKTFIPKEWAEANNTTAENFKGFLPLLFISKVFQYNCCGSLDRYLNCWDFVGKDGSGEKDLVRPLFMNIDSETVGTNFLYMLTSEKYSLMLKEAYDALSNENKAIFANDIASAEKDVEKVKRLYKADLGANAKYAFAWIKRFMAQYNAQTDDGPICNIIISKSAKGKAGLFVYSKLRSVQESETMSLNFIKVAAYDDDYVGMGGFGYCHYLFVTKNCPLPWTACAFISFLTTKQEGFDAWGKDMGCYSSNSRLNAENEAKYHHSRGGFDKDGNLVFSVKNDKGRDWWLNHLVLEDPEYCSKVAFTVGRWIDSLNE